VLGDAAGFWFVEVYADWCGHCKAAVPAVKEAAKALKGVVNFGGVNGDTASATAQRLGVQGFPTFKLLLADKSKPIDYNGPREAAAMVDFALKEVTAAVHKRMGKKGSSGGGGGGRGSGGGGQRAGGGGGGGSNEPGAGKHVIKGTAANFQSEGACFRV
jgi:protein disulfide-isomerase A6